MKGPERKEGRFMNEEMTASKERAEKSVSNIAALAYLLTHMVENQGDRAEDIVSNVSQIGAMIEKELCGVYDYLDMSEEALESGIRPYLSVM